MLQFGDLSIATQDAAGFEGTGRVFPNPPAAGAAGAGLADSRDISVLTRFDAYMSAAPTLRPAAASALIAEVSRREEADALFRAVAADLGVPAAAAAPRLTAPGGEACYVAAVDEVAEWRGWTDYSLKHARVLAALCDTRPQSEVLRAIRAHTGS